MTNQQILKKAIQKAIDGGWEYQHYLFEYTYPNFKPVWTGGVIVAIDKERGGTDKYTWLELTFNHDFAKALWGEELYESDEGYVSHRGDLPVEKDWQETFMGRWDFQMPAWAYHLTKMVIAEDPIKYLGENI